MISLTTAAIIQKMSQFHEPFSIIVMSETWIGSEKGAGFELDGYEFTT